MSGTAWAQAFPERGNILDAPRFLPVDDAFRFYVSIDSADKLIVHWRIAPDYYLYKDKFRFSVALAPETGSLGPVPVDEPLQGLAYGLPEGIAHHDQYFGDVEVYYLETLAELMLPPHLGRRFILRIEFQGCAEAGLCYPPQRRDMEIVVAGRR
jgi:thiol:disulfide interchange protein